MHSNDDTLLNTWDLASTIAKPQRGHAPNLKLNVFRNPEHHAFSSYSTSWISRTGFIFLEN